MYQCVKQAACQKDCADSSGKLHVTEPKVSLELLCPFSQYLISVSADDGPSSNLIFGTKIAEPVEAPEPSETPAVRTNTSLIVFWDQPDVCSGSLNNYVYQLYKANSSQVLKTGSTVNTNATFDNLHVSTDYRVLVFVNTSFGKINNNRYLEINVSTSATVPDKVQNLTVYKQGRHLLGLRWAQPVNTYGPIVSFTVKYGHAKDTNYKMEKIKPISCTAWPHLFCYTVTRLQADRLYKISVSARNSEVDADGDLAEVTGITKEKAPGPPENITLLNITSDSVSVQWSYPWLANGVVRSFLVSIEETEQFEEENCCQIYPLNEVTITDELEHYTTEVTGLHAASTYVVSISAKTVAFGPSQTITIHTRPPPLPILQLPNIVGNAFDTLDWEPLTQNFVNKSDIYKSLIKGSLVLIASDDIKVNSTGIKDEKLNEALKSLMPSKVYYLAAEYASSETEVHLGTGEDADGKWGEIHNPPLQANITYVLVVVQITEYCGVYNTDIALSAPFCAK